MTNSLAFKISLGIASGNAAAARGEGERRRAPSALGALAFVGSSPALATEIHFLEHMETLKNQKSTKYDRFLFLQRIIMLIGL